MVRLVPPPVENWMMISRHLPRTAAWISSNFSLVPHGLALLVTRVDVDDGRACVVAVEGSLCDLVRLLRHVRVHLFVDQRAVESGRDDDFACGKFHGLPSGS